MQTDTLDQGFADPVMDAQTGFRALMQAMSEPGTIHTAPPVAARPAQLNAAMAAVALTLFDATTPVWLDAAAAAGGDVAHWLGFHTGAAVTTDPAAARFALIAAPETLNSFTAFAPGTDTYPDRSATLVIGCNTLTPDGPLILEGPGIEATRRLAAQPLPVQFRDLWQANHTLFPQGVDLVLTAGNLLAALPRTTRITTEETG